MGPHIILLSALIHSVHASPLVSYKVGVGFTEMKKIGSLAVRKLVLSERRQHMSQ